MKKNILVFGGAGFIGSNFIRKIINKNFFVVNIDALTYASSKKNISDLNKFRNYKFIRSNIIDFVSIRKILKLYKPLYIINFAAETHVDRSIDNPIPFVRTNVFGVSHLINEIKNYWINLGLNLKNKFKFIQISTDEVYGSIDKGSANERSKYTTSSPYSASKAAADEIIMAFYKTYKFPIIITRCSNNYGPYQFPEKLIPLMIVNSIQEKDMPVYGKGNQIRDWIYVEDHVDAICEILKSGKIGEIYNIGGGSKLTNINVVKKISTLLDKKKPRKNNKSYLSLIKYVKDRPAHDKRYSVNISKIRKEVKWKPKINFNYGIEKTVDWYLANETWWKLILKNSYSGERLGKL